MFGSSIIASHAIAALSAAVLSALFAWQVQAWRYDTRVASIQAAQASRVAQAEATYRAQERALVAAKNLAEVRYAEQKKLAARSADGARIALDGLRDSIAASSGATASNPTASPGTDGSNAAREVVGECAGALVAMAAEADRLTVMVGGLQNYVGAVCRPSSH